jgi:hypothetical protein
MKYERIHQQISLNDPEKGFDFASNGLQLKLWFTDWRNRRVLFVFDTVYWFSHRFASGYRGLPEGEVLEIIESELIKSLQDDGMAGSGEVLHHFVISTNEDEWCEVVSEHIEIDIES